MKAAVAVAAVAALLVALPAAGAPSPLAGAAQLVTGRQIANNSITGKDVKNKSLTKGDFRGSVRGPADPAVRRVPQVLRARKARRARAASALFGTCRSSRPSRTERRTAFGATCPAGTYPTGGSAWAWDAATNSVNHPEVITADGLEYSASEVGEGYFANVDNQAGEDVEVVIDVACANANQVSLRADARLRR